MVKRYGEIVAVDHVDLTVERGDVYGYLGPNGAGKSTSLRIMLGLVRPSEGSVRIFGRDPQTEPAEALRQVAGFVESPAFYPYLSGHENLRLCADLSHAGARSRIDHALETVDLADRANDRVGGYSFGMRQRLGIAAALIREPRLLLLDEPTTGLDPAGMRDMRLLIRRLADQGITILLSSHLLDEVEELCNRVGILSHGRLIHEGALPALLGSTDGTFRLVTAVQSEALRVCRITPGLHDVQAGADAISFAADLSAVDALSCDLGVRGIAIRELVRVRATLEQLFFELTEPDSDGPAPNE